MDSLITAAARALAVGDPLAALKRVALRDDAPALALRGIAMAQLGDLVRAKALLRSAARAFGPKEAVARARCVVAEAEVALVSRDLAWPARALEAARVTLDEHGDRVNAAHARYLAVRRLVLIGRLHEAEVLLADFDPSPFPPASRAAHELVVAGIAIRRLRTKAARAALARAARAAREARIPRAGGGSRKGEARSDHSCSTAHCSRQAAAAAARRRRGTARFEGAHRGRLPPCRPPRRPPGVARHSSGAVRARPRARRRVACRRIEGRAGGPCIRIKGRRRIAIACVSVSKSDAFAECFGRWPTCGRRHVGSRWRPAVRVRCWCSRRPSTSEHAAVLAFLADGESWSSSALALALGTSQRTAQRALDALAATGKVQSFGRGRARRWMTPSLTGFTTTLLLPAPLPID